MVEDFPRAVFGKPDGASAYQIISQDKALKIPEVARAFQKICSSFEWKPTVSDKIHPACVGVLPFGELILLARYTDSGRDMVGRPHTLRIDCILTSAEKFPDAWESISPNSPAPPIPEGDNLEIIGDDSTYTAQLS